MTRNIAVVCYAGQDYVAACEPSDGPVALLSRLPEGHRGVLECILGLASTEGPAICEVGREEVSFRCPTPRVERNVFCVGKNYSAHAAEFSRSGFDSSSTVERPEAPVVFTKTPETLAGPHTKIRFPEGVSDAIDYEAEFALVIGKAASRVRAEDALRHVWGITLANDLTARDVQKRHTQWILGKSFESFLPLGPTVLVTDGGTVPELSLECHVNGERRQSASTSALIFGFAEIIAAISQYFPLRPGDLIATGTPEGVGIGFNPPRFLCPGDRVTVSSPAIGTMSTEFF